MVASAGALGAATWLIPGGNGLNAPENPNYPALKVAAAKLPPPPAYLLYHCHERPNDASCLTQAKSWAVGAQSYLIVPHEIPDSDCQLMAMALKHGHDLNNDGTLYKRPDGRMNCDFSRYGLAHKAYPEKPDGYKIMGNYVSEYIGSREEYEISVREDYVKQPVYSLFLMRARVDYGWNNKHGHGGMCVFNRYTGQWRLEKPCEMTWES